MAIVEMNKLSLIALNRDKNRIIDLLMKMGVCEVVSSQDRLSVPEWSQVVSSDDRSYEISDIAAKMEKVSFALDYLEQFDTSKKPLFFYKRRITEKEVSDIINKSDELWEVVSTIIAADEKMSQLKSQSNRLNNVVTSLMPWKSLDVPLNIQSTTTSIVSLGVIPSAMNTEVFIKEIQEKSQLVHVEKVNSDSEQSYLFLVYEKSQEEIISPILKEYGFSKVSFKEYEDNANNTIQNAQNSIDAIKEQLSEAENTIKGLVEYKSNLEVLHDWLATKMAGEEALDKLLTTDKAFFLEGWVPKKLKQTIEKALTEGFDCMVQIEEPSDEDEVPVLLENNGFSQSVEAITDMYSTPNYKEIDPNTIMAPFFVLFFGLMLGDGGYGLLMVLACTILLWKVNLEASMRRFFKLMLFCGISTTFWGAMFGGWFGIASLSKYGIWFNPVEDPEELLKWSLLFGIIHIFVGLGVRGANYIRKKQYLDVLFDVVFWYIFFGGFALFVLPYAPKINAADVQGLVELGKYMLIIGAVLLVATQGRNKKGLFGKLIGGVSSMYDLISFMSDVLSYSRLLALGLATSVIASIVNDMSMMVGYSGIKFIGFVAVLLIGHTFNFAINALGAYVHSSRLQYIEFFGKFYTGGGVAFEALKADTKYITII